MAYFVASVDVSDVTSYWQSGGNVINAELGGNLNYGEVNGRDVINLDILVHPNWQGKIDPSDFHVYDVASCTEIEWEPAYSKTSVRLNLENRIGKTLLLILTNQTLADQQLQALNRVYTESDKRFLTLHMPSENDCKQQLDDAGYLMSGDLKVTSTSSYCGTVSGSFSIPQGWNSITAGNYALYIDGSKVKSGTFLSNGLKSTSFSKSGFIPNTSHTVTLTVTTTARGVSVTNTYTATQRTASFGKASVTPVKLSSSKVSIGVTVPARECGKGLTYVRVYKGSKLIKKFTTTGKEKYIFTYSATGASKASYRVKAYWAKKTSISATSSYAKARSSSKNFSASANPARYAKYKHYFKLKSVSQSGSYVVVKGFFMNTHLYPTKIKCNFSLKVNGSTVAKKSLTSKKLGQNRVQYVTFKVKPKSMKDLYNYTSGGSWTVYEV